MRETEFIKDGVLAGSSPVGGAADSELDALYLELGKAYYEGAFEDPLPQLLPLFDKISEALKKYEEIAPAPEPEPEPVSAPVCPVCGTTVGEGTKFCAVCGTNLQGPAPQQPFAAPEEKRCPGCGSVVTGDAKFCEVCGTKL